MDDNIFSEIRMASLDNVVGLPVTIVFKNIMNWGCYIEDGHVKYDSSLPDAIIFAENVKVLGIVYKIEDTLLHIRVGLTRENVDNYGDTGVVIHLSIDINLVALIYHNTGEEYSEYYEDLDSRGAKRRAMPIQYIVGSPITDSKGVMLRSFHKQYANEVHELIYSGTSHVSTVD